MRASILGPISTSFKGYPLPVGGQASCGFPSPALDYSHPDLSLDELVGITPTCSLFLLRAWGDSMTAAGIFNDDVLVVDKARNAQEGEIVVAIIGAEFLVKRLGRAPDGRPALLAETPSMRQLYWQRTNLSKFGEYVCGAFITYLYNDLPLKVIFEAPDEGSF